MDKLFGLEAERILLLIVDIQQRLMAAVSEREEVSVNAVHLIELCKLFNVPVMVTEQYPKGIGPTVPAVREALGVHYKPVDKLSFSCCKADSFMERLKAFNRDTIVIVGIETHVCVLQTCIDLLMAGYAVHVVGDATASRRAENRDAGLRYMGDAGAVVTTTEIVLFQVLKMAGTDYFKTISKRIK